MRFLVSVLAIFAPLAAFAYDSTDNTSKNKYERIGVVENFLKSADADISQLKMEMSKVRATLTEMGAIKMELEKLKAKFDALQNAAPSAPAPTPGAGDVDIAQFKKDFEKMRYELMQSQIRVDTMTQDLKQLTAIIQSQTEFKKASSAPAAGTP